MRRHASSWGIKVILAAIIVSFVFFFGYSTMRRGGRGGDGSVVATVNEAPIPLAEFQFFYDNALERVRKQFSGKQIPDFVRKMAQSQTLNQLVLRELVLQQAEKLGVVIPDDELANVILKVQTAQQGGEFDPIFYRHQFLPYFKNRYGLDYEKFVRSDLEVQSFQEIFAGVDTKSPLAGAEDETPKEIVWTFETVAIDPKALTEDKLVKTPEEARAFADELIATPPAQWNRRLRKLKLKAQKSGPIKLAERRKLLGGNGTHEDYQEIFTLTPEKSVVQKPMERGDKLYIVRLVSVQEEEGKPSQAGASPFFGAWMAKLQKKAKIQSFLEQEPE